jgi:hypothetical protein
MRRHQIGETYRIVRILGSCLRCHLKIVKLTTPGILYHAVRWEDYYKRDADRNLELDGNGIFHDTVPLHALTA